MQECQPAPNEHTVRENIFFTTTHTFIHGIGDSMLLFFVLVFSKDFRNIFLCDLLCSLHFPHKKNGALHDSTYTPNDTLVFSCLHCVISQLLEYIQHKHKLNTFTKHTGLWISILVCRIILFLHNIVPVNCNVDCFLYKFNELIYWEVIYCDTQHRAKNKVYICTTFRPSTCALSGCLWIWSTSSIQCSMNWKIFLLNLEERRTANVHDEYAENNECSDEIIWLCENNYG